MNVQEMTLSVADQERARGLRRMRWVATGLLVLAGVIFALTVHRDGAWGYVNATAEAAMVGAIADWFAVTALFRHPLGLPIPHTALIPRRKDMFAKGLEDFVSGHFLTGDAARERVIAAGAVPRGVGWLADPEHARWVTAQVATLGSRVLEQVRDDDVAEIVRSSIIPRLVREPLSPVAGQLLAGVVDDGAHVPVVDIVVSEARAWLREHPGEFMAIVGERAPSWSPSWVSALVADRVYTEALRWVDDVWHDPRHRVRLAVDSLLRDFAHALQTDPATMVRAERAKERLLTHPETQATVEELWAVARRTLEDALGSEDSALRTRAAAALTGWAASAQQDPEQIATLERRVGDLVASLVDTYAAEVAPVITQVVARWDGKEAAERIELHVGRDLQFIRINGTIVGGLAGLLIHTLSHL